jgi:hypothetical protein
LVAAGEGSVATWFFSGLPGEAHLKDQLRFS